MKLICDCGNEMEFSLYKEEFDEDLDLEDEEEEDERGQYVVIEHDKFETWSEHDAAGFVCRQCNKAIWYFA